MTKLTGDSLMIDRRRLLTLTAGGVSARGFWWPWRGKLRFSRRHCEVGITARDR